MSTTSQGTITQTDNPLGLAIAGQGFFAVSQQNGEVNNIPHLQSAAVLHARRRLPDGQERLPGEQRRASILNGWPVNPLTGAVEPEHPDSRSR